MRLIFIIALGVAGYLLYKLYFQKLMAQGKAGKIKIGLIVLGLLLVLAALTGRANALFAIVGAAMTQVMRLAPLLIKFAPGLAKHFGGSMGHGGQAGPSQSRVSTKTLVMTLDHVSGKMDGDLIAGAFAGKRLSELSTEQLKQCYNECLAADPEAIRLLQAYIARERADWEDAPNDQNTSEQAQLGDGINVREAYDILGLEPGATKSDVRQAHRSLMTQFHPDKGGSNYLASKVNEAKKVLLSHIGEE